MHQDPLTAVLIPEISDCASPAHRPLPEIDLDRLTPANDVPPPFTPAGHDRPVPPPFGPPEERRRRTWWPAILGTVVAVVACDTAWPGTLQTVAFMAAIAAGIYLYRRYRSTPSTPQESSVPYAVPGQPIGARTYRVRIFDNHFEVLRDKTLTVYVDLASPSAETILMSTLARYAEAARVAREQIDHPRMQIHDMITGVKILDVL